MSYVRGGWDLLSSLLALDVMLLQIFISSLCFYMIYIELYTCREMPTNFDKDMETELEEDSDVDSEEDDADIEDSKEDEETVKKISELNQTLFDNPYDYSAHLELVNLLRKTDNFTQLRSARKAFSEKYPLTGDLWIQWIEDEIKVISSDEEKAYIVELFEKGLKDYVSVDLWLEYCQFKIGDMAAADGVKKIRDVFERALVSCGRNVARGSLIWDAYREFEAVCLTMSGDKDSETFNSQNKRMLGVFKRQLGVPLLGMEETLNEYKKMTNDSVEDSISSSFKKAKSMLDKRVEFETKLKDIQDGKTLELYNEYIEFEKKEKDPVMIQQLFERAISDHCLHGPLWTNYLLYLEANLNIPDVCLGVYNRAIRNVPWCKDIWCDYLRALERFKQPHSDIRDIFEQSLSGGFQESGAFLDLWLCFLDYMRRRAVWEKDVTPTMSDLRTAFERANEHLGKIQDDPTFQVSKYWANLEADQFGMMDSARKIWTEITAADPFKSSTWLEYIILEKLYGDKKHLRKAYQRAVEKTYDNPEAVIQSFLQFEREEGSLESFEQARKLGTNKMIKVTAAREKENALKEGDENQKKLKREEKKKDKSKQNGSGKWQWGNGENVSNGEKQTSQESNGFKVPAAKKVVPPPPGFKSPSGAKAVPPPPGFKEGSKRDAQHLSEEDNYQGKRPKYDESDAPSEEDKKQRTVFISNLGFTVTEDELRDFMSSTGLVTDVRLVKKPTGQSKGYAFVEFDQNQTAQAALKRDNEFLNGRPVYISECDPSKKREFKYDTGLEKNKLFIGNLDPAVTRAELIECFSKFGKVREARIPVKRNGEPKGIAFLEYEDEVSAASAIVRADNMTLKTKAIKVALSNPPERKPESSAGSFNKASASKMLGKGTLAFTPRSISVPAKPKKRI